MTLLHTMRTFSLAGATLLLLAATASATPVTYTTQATTGFGGTSLVLNNSSGDHPATLTFLVLPPTVITVPSNINYGFFTLTCNACTETSGSVFSAFTFDMVITDLDSGATGTFVGTSAGGSIFSNSSNLTISWLPTQIGPGTTNATSGDFGFTRYTNELTTNIVAPNSGVNPGTTTVQGFVASEVPEPAALGMIGLGLFGIGLFRRHRSNRL